MWIAKLRLTFPMRKLFWNNIWRKYIPIHTTTERKEITYVFNCGDSRQVKQYFQLLMLVLVGKCIFWALNDLVALRRSNIKDRSSTVRTTLLCFASVWPVGFKKMVKKDLNCKFRVQGVLRQKILWNWKSWAPLNYGATAFLTKAFAEKNCPSPCQKRTKKPSKDV